MYPDNPNGPAPSVTSITQALHKGALIQWAADCAVDYIAGKASDWDDTFCMEGLTEPRWLGEARTAYKIISTEAANTGTDVHELCQLWLDKQDTREAESKATPGMLALFEAFKGWAIDNKIEPVYIEKVLHGDGYSGRCDLIAYRTDPKTGVRMYGLYDIKTSSGAYYPEHGLQLAAYAMAYEHWELTDGNGEWPLQEVGIIKLNKKTLRCNFSEGGRGPNYTKFLPRLQKAFTALVEFFWQYNNLKEQFEEIQNGQSSNDEEKP